MFNKYFNTGPNLMGPISCDFFLKVDFKYLEAKYWTYWTVFNIYFIRGSYLMDSISRGFFRGPL